MTLINDFEGEEPQRGEIRPLRITEAHDYDLIGTLLAGQRELRAGAGARRPDQYPGRAVVRGAEPDSCTMTVSARSAVKKCTGRIPNSRSAASAAGSSTWATGRRRST